MAFCGHSHTILGSKSLVIKTIDPSAKPCRPSQQTRHIEAMLVQCRARVEDDGSTLNQHCFNVSCLLGNVEIFMSGFVPLTQLNYLIN